MMGQLGEYNVDFCGSEDQASLCAMVIQPTLVWQVIEAQWVDNKATSFCLRLANGEGLDGWLFDTDQGFKFLLEKPVLVHSGKDKYNRKVFYAKMIYFSFKLQVIDTSPKITRISKIPLRSVESSPEHFIE